MVRIDGNFFLCIGAQKAGTRWLHDNLNSHPEVWVPLLKELHYFDGIHVQEHASYLNKLIQSCARKAASAGTTVATESARREASWLARYGSTTDPDDAWYASLFAEADGDSAFGEITPEYAMLSEEGFSHIRRLAPGVKIIFIMRDPVQRVWSQVRFRARNTRNPDLLRPERAIAFSDTFACEARTRYDVTIERLEKVISRDQILYLFYEDIAADGLGLLRRVTSFLNVDFEPAYFPGAKTRLNASPAADMPHRLCRHLRAKYAYLPDAVAERIGPVPAAWRDALGAGS